MCGLCDDGWYLTSGACTICLGQSEEEKTTSENQTVIIYGLGMFFSLNFCSLAMYIYLRDDGGEAIFVCLFGCCLRKLHEVRKKNADEFAAEVRG